LHHILKEEIVANLDDFDENEVCDILNQLCAKMKNLYRVHLKVASVLAQLEGNQSKISSLIKMLVGIVLSAWRGL
jgi:hypothetical protein